MRIFVAISIILFLICYDVTAQDTTCNIIWSAPVELSPFGGNPRIAVQGEILHVTWDGSIALPYLRSTNDGISWDSLKDLWLPDSTRQPNNRWVLASGQTLLYLWGDYVNATDKTHIAFRTSSDRGTTWSDIQRYINARGTYPYDATIFSNTVVIRINYQGRTGSWPFIARSTNLGMNWSISVDSIPGTEMKLALSNEGLHIAYEPFYDPYPYPSPEIEYRHSIDLGNSWESTILLSTDDGEGSMIPAIGVGKNKVMVAWRDQKYGCGSLLGCSIVGRLSTDNGSNWQNEEIISDDIYGVSSTLAFKGNLTVAAWKRYSAGHQSVKVLVKRNGDMPCNSIELIDSHGSAQQVAITERAIHIVYEYDDGSNFHIYYRRGALLELPVTVPVNSRWNMVSVPVYAADKRKSVLFPTAVSSAYTYRDNHYVVEETLKVGQGYWMKFPSAENVSVTGVPTSSNEIPLVAGWNMIGGLASPFPVNSITTEPANIISSSFFGYKGSYTATDTLQPGKGYWVKVNTTGTLILGE